MISSTTLSRMKKKRTALLQMREVLRGSSELDLRADITLVLVFYSFTIGTQISKCTSFMFMFGSE